MPLRTYQATARKVHAAYHALWTAADTARWADAEQLRAPLYELRASVNAMRQQVCRECDAYGTLINPEGRIKETEAGWSYICQHWSVPTFDARTGEFREVAQP